ncbi:MAG: hypothetical protein J7K31_02710 [Candidatus Aenigmarchaeota archaeon]|nr:hypothetical protein [Candidatus Aenigmarchaeota archaeon]
MNYGNETANDIKGIINTHKGKITRKTLEDIWKYNDSTRDTLRLVAEKKFPISYNWKGIDKARFEKVAKDAGLLDGDNLTLFGKKAAFFVYYLERNPEYRCNLEV